MFINTLFEYNIIPMLFTFLNNSAIYRFKRKNSSNMRYIHDYQSKTANFHVVLNVAYTYTLEYLLKFVILSIFC